MGGSCSCENTKKAVDELAEHIEEKGVVAVLEDTSGDAAEAWTEAAHKAAHAAEHVAEKVAEVAKKVAHEAVEIADDAKEHIVEAAEAAQDKAVEVQHGAQQVVKESVEATCATMDAAVAAVTGVMIVEFVADKGAVRKVSFKTKNVGFEIAMSGGGCCGPAAQARVAVKNVDKKGQAEAVGVKCGWRVKSINGTEVTGLKPAQKLLEESVAKLTKA
mmetsp:Transcript_51796/g.148511  ORF Transcript_51796/g.148511 Transcript_51796/m.148511 type:complete len:217 (+) Transcript_51796:93-743(+)